jgi:hypothetical protein
MRVARQALIVQSGRAWPVLLLLVALAAAYAWWYLAPDTIPDVVRKQLPISAAVRCCIAGATNGRRPHVTDAPPRSPLRNVVRSKTNVVPSVCRPTAERHEKP